MTHSVTKMPPELKTLRDWMRWASSQFRAANLYFGHGTANAWDEAVYLVLHALHLPPDFSSAHFNARLTQSEKQAVFDLIQRRTQERCPAAYLTQEAWFAGMPFYVDPRVLIPRSPLAELIENQFAPWIVPQNIQRILEIGTGSGCIAITCAHFFPQAEIVATDISLDALAVAKINCEQHQVADRVQLIQSDVFGALPKNQLFDVIISNPPYVDAEDMQSLPAEYRHEPALALAAGKDGLSVVEKILINAKNYLTPQGILITEVGNSANALQQRFSALPFTWLEFSRGESEVFLLNYEAL